MRIEDLSLSSKTILVHGKGRRERALPLWKTDQGGLRAWLAVRGKAATPELFVNARGGPMSRWGFAYVLQHHAKTASHKCPSLSKKQISPHVLRHTCAMVVLKPPSYPQSLALVGALSSVNH